MLILAFASNPREDLLKQIGVYSYKEHPQTIVFNESYDVENTGYNNSLECNGRPERIVDDISLGRAVNALNVYQKRKSVDLSNYVFLGAVTKLYEKGTDRFLKTPIVTGHESLSTLKQITEEAKELLLMLKGKEINVYTSCCFITEGDSIKTVEDLKKDGKLVCCKTNLHFRNFHDREIEKYLESSEAFNKSGGFAIQNRGSLLLHKIEGSFSGAIGLPLYEILNYFSKNPKGLNIYNCICKQLNGSNNVEDYQLAITTMGDINYDYVHQFPQNFKLNTLGPKRYQVIGEIPDGIGGTGTNFATAAKEAGFNPCYLFGRVGNDHLGEIITKELENRGVDTKCIIKDTEAQTSKSLLLRYTTEGKDGYITITDQKQSWDKKNLKELESIFSSSNVLYISGYCIIDPKRYGVTLKAMENAKVNYDPKSNKVVVLELVVDFIEEFRKQDSDFKNKFTWLQKENISRYETFVNETLMKDKKCLVDILVAESRTINELFGQHVFGEDLSYSEKDQRYIECLKQKFKVIIVRNADTSKELIIFSNKNAVQLRELRHNELPAVKKKGYRAKRLAYIIYSFLGPRIGLITENSEKIEILEKVITPNNIFPIKVEYENIAESNTKDIDNLLKSFNELKIRGNLNKTHPATIKVIVSSHSAILYNNRYLPRPHDKASAEKLLCDLKGREFKIKTCVSAFGVKGKNKGLMVSEITENTLKMQEINDDIIEAFIRSEEWKDSILGFSFQGKGEAFIKSIEGSFSGSAGLSIESLYKILKDNFEINCWDLDNVNNWELDEDIISDNYIFKGIL